MPPASVFNKLLLYLSYQTNVPPGGKRGKINLDAVTVSLPQAFVPTSLILPEMGGPFNRNALDGSLFLRYTKLALTLLSIKYALTG
jgi:hypothetical protein